MKILAKDGKIIKLNGGAILPPSAELQAKTVDLSMASGDQVIMPDEGYSLSEVTVTKPSTLIPENIKKDVDIGGVVGTMEGGGVSGKRSVTFSGADSDSYADIFYIEDGVFKETKIGASLADAITIAVDFGTTIYVRTGTNSFSYFIPSAEGASAINYITEGGGRILYANLMYILEQ